MIAIRKAETGKLLALVEDEESAERFRKAVGCEVTVGPATTADKRGVLTEGREHFASVRQAQMEERARRRLAS